MTGSTGELRIKRVYQPAAPTDGCRVLVDRLWPRGISKPAAALDLWLKEIAPSPELRTWWNHDPDRLDEFTARYRAELDHNPAVGTLRDLLSQHERVTLLYGAKDPRINQAAVLQQYLTDQSEDAHRT
ncbi:MAG: DUF488 domain-containing protein [Propionicimonas sp.]|uniref:DUF488 domain-containing protein n=1 Tax=Propionicimonas sp. TaxID=1955623 RepID=UPI002B1F8F8E|nr:DUF488 domain-containing protein [Propionicimonas sp.]MEA4945629.1 DUF488 domain-containing protein [Propionicimonas sp.]MEA5054782.1 DUF488 domain-containing protein [Propionicimonas sp.]